MALSGKVDRRTYEKTNFLYGIVILLFASVIAGFIAMFLLGGGDFSFVEAANIKGMWTFVRSAEYNAKNGNMGIYVGLLVFLITFCYMFMDYEKKKNSRFNEEHGSSKFMTAKDMPAFNRNFLYDPEIVKKYKWRIRTRYDNIQLKKVLKKFSYVSRKAKEECFLNSQIMGQDVYLSMNTKFINRNLNTITIGGSGQGKSYSELFPNALMGTSNYVFTDPSGEILLKVGKFLEEECGYLIKVFNVDEFQKSMKYNPLLYIETEKDYSILVDALNRNIKPNKVSGNTNEFFDDAKDSLMCALIALLKELYPITGDLTKEQIEINKSKQTLKNVMRLLLLAEQEVKRDKAGREVGHTSTLDKIFEKLEEHDSRSYAAACWKSFKIGGPRVCNEVIISACAVFSRFFNADDLEWLTSKDELCLEDLASDRPCALFIVTPASDTSYNFMASMIYTQLFSIVTKAGKNYAEQEGLSNPTIPRHLSMWLDEFANCGKIPQFKELLSVVRKYNISINILVQALSQLKGMYKDDWETIIGNLDTMIYLGGQEPTTIKTLSEKLGKETIKTHNYTINKRTGGGESYQNQGRNLLTPDEIEQMARAHELVFITGCKPIQTKKYNLSEHPNYRFSGEYSPSNNYDVGRFYRNNEIDYEALDRAAITEEEIKSFSFDSIPLRQGHKAGKKKEENAKENTKENIEEQEKKKEELRENLKNNTNKPIEVVLKAVDVSSIDFFGQWCAI